MLEWWRWWGRLYQLLCFLNELKEYVRYIDIFASKFGRYKGRRDVKGVDKEKVDF